MLRHLGYACINESLKPKSFKSCRLNSVRTKGLTYLQEIIYANLDFLLEIIQWNINNKVMFYRVSSDLLPLVTHPEVLDMGYQWDEDPFILNRLKKIKDLVEKYDLRLSMHPDQYTVLNSPREEVYTNSVIYLAYHARLLELMGGQDMILHVGGVYGDKEKSKKRFITRYLLLNDTIKGYLRLENDDKSYTIHDILEISKETGVSVVLDYHHHRCHHTRNLTRDDVRSIVETWSGIPKLHLSKGRNTPVDRAHHDYVEKADVLALNEILADYTYDLMLEAKKKELALLQLRKVL